MDVHREEWYRRTLAREENITFGHLEIERLFETPPEEYTRVLPMTRVVKISRGEEEEKGILLIQLKQSGLQDVFSDLLLGEGSYLYLTDADGNLLCHPKQELVESGLLEEWNPSGEYDSRPQGGDKKAEYFVNTVGYTGWKIVGVIQSGMVMLNAFQSSMMILFLLLFFVSVMVLINSFLSRKVSAPMRRLEEAVNQIEAGDLDTRIQPSGFYEVWHLGKAISQMQENLKRLMADIVEEHEAKRRSELMALQNQINPHFLYNTLDVIVWLIENGKREEAVEAVTALARFFRISLSGGKNIIPIGDEIEHVRNYLMIQELRFKNRFTYSFDVEEGVENCGTIKLILQPVVENAIYHGIRIEEKRRGKVKISACGKDGLLLLFVENDGKSMPMGEIDKINQSLQDTDISVGYGIHNVNKRLQLEFGSSFGLHYEPGCPNSGGVKVTITLPYR